MVFLTNAHGSEGEKWEQENLINWLFYSSHLASRTIIYTSKQHLINISYPKPELKLQYQGHELWLKWWHTSSTKQNPRTTLLNYPEIKVWLPSKRPSTTPLIPPEKVHWLPSEILYISRGRIDTWRPHHIMKLRRRRHLSKQLSKIWKPLRECYRMN